MDFNPFEQKLENISYEPDDEQLSGFETKNPPLFKLYKLCQDQ
jgi:hypothetical protein